MICSNIQYQLMDYIRDKISDEEKHVITEHLNACKSCQKELQKLIVVTNEINKVKEWSPSPLYWNSILPRVHDSIHRSHKKGYTQLIPRFVLPAAAVVVLIIFSLYIIPVGDNSIENTEVSLQQFQSEELEELIHEQLVVGVLEPTTGINGLITSSDDKAILQELLKDSNGSLISMYDDETLFASLSDDEAARIVSIIQRSYK